MALYVTRHYFSGLGEYPRAYPLMPLLREPVPLPKFNLDHLNEIRSSYIQYKIS